MDPTWPQGQLSTGDGMGTDTSGDRYELCFHMAQDFLTLALIWGLVKTALAFFHRGMDRDET